MYDVILAAAPQTGDNFPAFILIGVVAAAVIVAVAMTVVGKKKKSADDEYVDDE